MFLWPKGRYAVVGGSSGDFHPVFLRMFCRFYNRVENLGGSGMDAVFRNGTPRERDQRPIRNVLLISINFYAKSWTVLATLRSCSSSAYDHRPGAHSFFYFAYSTYCFSALTSSNLICILSSVYKSQVVPFHICASLFIRSGDVYLSP